MTGSGGVTMKAALNEGDRQRSVIVQVTVAVPPSQRSGTVTEAASLATCGSQPPATAAWVSTSASHVLKAVLRAAWSAKSQASTDKS